ncbi:MAG TPA: hypothetical protein V6C97_24130 [Oculatellaceae cyanobacterium]
MKSLLKNLCDKIVMRSTVPPSEDAWYHPASEAFWPSLRQVQYVNECVEVLFDGVLNTSANKFFSGILTGEQQLEWEARKNCKNRWHLNPWQPRKSEELPWYQPHNDYFWGQISNVRMSAKKTVLVFNGRALHDGFRLLVRGRSASVSAPGGDFLMTSQELSNSLREWYGKHSESTMFNYWATVHPEVLAQPNWRQHVIEQAAIEVELVRRKDQLKTLINDAFNTTR